mgnify:CR=1 FL=1
MILFLCTVWSGAYIIFLMTIQKLNLHQCNHKKDKKNKCITEVYSLDTERKIKDLYDEITMLKSYITKHKESLRNIVRKLPFKGEEWMQEYIREDVDDMLKRVDEQQSEESEDTNEPEIKEEVPEIVVSDEQKKQLGDTEELPVDEESVAPVVLPTVEKAQKDLAKLEELDEDDIDDISVTPSIVTTVAPTPQMVMVMPLETAMAMSAAQPTQVIQSQVPQAPQTIVVDTSDEAMKSQGLLPTSTAVPLKPILKRAPSPVGARGKKLSFAINKVGGDEVTSDISSNMKVNIIKTE